MPHQKLLLPQRELLPPQRELPQRELPQREPQLQELQELLRLRQNRRHTTSAQVAHAFAVLRAYGFKLHVHFMTNLLGMTPETDRADYRRLVEDARYLPDEVKLYPCALVESSRLMSFYHQSLWRPYSEEELVELLVDDVLATPAYTRISRTIVSTKVPFISRGRSTVKRRYRISCG